MTIRQNLDLDIDKWFLNHDSTQLVKMRDLKTEPLSNQIYFSPTYSPLIHVRDSDLGSCFQGWKIPTGSYLLDQQNGLIIEDLLPTDIGLDTYREAVWETLIQNLTSVFHSHKEVNLSYSGGIDSMVVLAAIKHLGLMPRTNLVIVRNHTQTHHSCLHIDAVKQKKLHDTLARLRKQCRSITHIDIDQESVNLSAHDYNHLRCYITSTLMRNTCGQAWIFGFHGNQLLLHKDIFAYEILRRSPEKTNQLADLSRSQNFYTTQLLDLKLDMPWPGLEKRHLLNKPWHLFDHINGNRIYAPLGSDLLFDLCRRLDFSLLDLEFVAEARLAREIISRAGQDWLFDFVDSESIHEMDNLESMILDVDGIDIEIPQLNHDIDGLYWLREEQYQARSTGKIPINSLVSIKNLQWISQQ